MQTLLTSPTRVYTGLPVSLKMPTCTFPQIHPQDNQADYPLKSKLPPVPDLDNRRFCRACGCTRPLSAFPSGKRRFLCKNHIWQRVQQPSKQRAMAKDSHKRKLWTLWKKCWTDAKRTFKHERILLLQRDIEETLAQLEDSSNNGQEVSCPGPIRDSTAETLTETQPTSAGLIHDATTLATAETLTETQPTSAGLIHDSITEATTEAQTTSDTNHPTAALNAQPTSDTNHPTAASDVQTTAHKDRGLDIALMPSNPQHPLSRDNVVVVDRNARRVLLEAFRQGGADKYISELGAMD